MPYFSHGFFKFCHGLFNKAKFEDLLSNISLKACASTFTDIHLLQCILDEGLSENSNEPKNSQK
jgi:hypothetical protein